MRAAEISTSDGSKALDGGAEGRDRSEAQYRKLPAEWHGKSPVEAKERLCRVPGNSSGQGDRDGYRLNTVNNVEKRCYVNKIGIFNDEGRRLNTVVFVQEFNPGRPIPFPRPLRRLQVAPGHANIAQAAPLIQLTPGFLDRKGSGARRTGAGSEPARRRTPEIEARKINETHRFSLARAWCRQLHPGRFWGLQARIFRASKRD